MTSMISLGFNEEKIKKVAEEIQTSADEAIASIISMIETNIVTPVSGLWVAEEAVDYFGKFKEYCDKIPYAVYYYFDTFRQRLELAYKRWIANTGAGAEFEAGMASAATVSLPAIAPNGELKQLDVSSIISITEAGDRGANTEGLEEFILTLGTVKESIISAIKVDTLTSIEVALIGGSQSTSASTAFTHVYDLIEDIFDFLTIDDPESGSQSLKSAMEAVNEKYGSVETNISTDVFGSESSPETTA